MREGERFAAALEQRVCGDGVEASGAFHKAAGDQQVASFLIRQGDEERGDAGQGGFGEKFKR